MKILFSEHKSDYQKYIFPYVIWAFPEPGEDLARIFNRGFLPSSKNLDRFYLCRNVRVRLEQFQPSSENRRIIRKGQGLQCKIVPRADFDLSDDWRHFCKTYADQKFGLDIMTFERLDALFSAPIVSHLLVFSDPTSHKDVGLVLFFLRRPELAFYYYSFYDMDYSSQNLGMYMMTISVALMKEQNLKYIYLGSCYTRNALYKTQFSGAQFFNGFRWSDDLQELKFLIAREQNPIEKHLLESNDFLEMFYTDGLLRLSNDFGYSINS